MKRCPTCCETKQISDFYQSPSRPDALSVRCILCSQIAVKASDAKLRLRVIQHLGGVCVRCGYDTPGPALQIDHVLGDGAEQRRANGSPRAMLNTVLTDDTGRYQLLCANCNQIKRIMDGEHKGRRVYSSTVPTGTHTKRCAKCETVKTVQEFLSNSARCDGLSVYCRPCTKAGTERDRHRLRTSAVAALGASCVHCGYAKDSRALQIDHINSDASADKQRGMIGGTLYRAIINGATNNYQILCANCNIIKRVAVGEHGPRRTHRLHPATYRRQTRTYLTKDQIAEVAKLVAVCGLTQSEVGTRFGINQTTVGRHTRKLYPPKPEASR